MNVLRRLFLSLYSILIGLAAGGLVTLAWKDSERLNALIVKDLRIHANITAPDDAARILFTVILGAIAALAIFTFVLSYLPQHWKDKGSTRGALRLRQADGGTVDVPVSALETLLREELEALPEIRTAKPTVRVSGGAVSVDLDLAIEPSASIANVTSLAGNTVARALKDQVGVTAVRRPHVRISYDEVNARPVGFVAGPPRVPPTPPPSPPVQASAPPPPGPTVKDDDDEEPHD